MKLLKRISIVVIVSIMVCLPIAINDIQNEQWPVVYKFFSALARGLGYNIIGVIFGVIVLIAARNRESGGLKQAIIVSIVTGIAMSYIIYRASTAENEIHIINSTQKSGELTKEKMNNEVLKKLEQYWVSQIKTQVEKPPINYAVNSQDIISESKYIENKKYKLAIIQIKIASTASAVIVSGIIGSELKSVGCTSKGNTVPDITSGICGEAVEKIFEEIKP